MLKQFSILAVCIVTLTGCDAATQIAGEAVQGEIRNAVSAQCQQVAEGAGIVAARVNQVCECSADAFMADPELTLDDVSPERLEGIVNDCAATTASQAAPTSETTPAE